MRSHAGPLARAQRPLFASLVLALVAATVPAAAQEGDAGAYDDDAYYDEEEVYEEEFCGGGEESEYDMAYMAYDGEQYEEARDVLVEALRSRSYYTEMRPAYLVLLGQTQIRLGDTRHAAVNFQRAIAAEPDQADENGARIGLAVALASHGNRRRAAEVAQQFVDTQCHGDSGRAPHCYVANVVIGNASVDGESREKGRTEARRLAATLRDWEQNAVAYYDELFDVAGWPGTPDRDTDESGDESA